MIVQAVAVIVQTTVVMVRHECAVFERRIDGEMTVVLQVVVLVGIEVLKKVGFSHSRRHLHGREYHLSDVIAPPVRVGPAVIVQLRKRRGSRCSRYERPASELIRRALLRLHTAVDVCGLGITSGIVAAIMLTQGVVRFKMG